MSGIIDGIQSVDLGAFFSVDPLSWTSMAAGMLSAGIIGWERQLKGKPVGIRTSILICLGTYVFVAIGASVAGDKSDPSRVIGQVVTGIGFLGAGVMLAKEGNVIGVTSAACIWMLAAIGVLIGTQDAGVGIKLALLTVFVLVGVDYCESSFKRLQRGVHSHLSNGGARRSSASKSPIAEEAGSKPKPKP